MTLPPGIKYRRASRQNAQVKFYKENQWLKDIQPAADMKVISQKLKKKKVQPMGCASHREPAVDDARSTLLRPPVAHCVVRALYYVYCNVDRQPHLALPTLAR
jgi:hypothetical protein